MTYAAATIAGARHMRRAGHDVQAIADRLCLDVATVTAWDDRGLLEAEPLPQMRLGDFLGDDQG